MEPITIFAVSVGLIGVCRLTFAAAAFFGKGIYSKGRKPVKREEWHCFFKISDLRGPEKRRQTAISDNSIDQRRRPQQAPRLRAERNMR